MMLRLTTAVAASVVSLGQAAYAATDYPPHTHQLRRRDKCRVGPGANGNGGSIGHRDSLLTRAC